MREFARTSLRPGAVRSPDRARAFRCSVCLVAACAALFAAPLHAAQAVINGPFGSGAFGYAVAVLPNGNFVVVDPGFSLPGPNGIGVGAVYLYRADGALISTLRGSSIVDRVGGGGVVVLGSGNYLVLSPEWDNAGVIETGAVTFCPGDVGINGVVSPANSLVGTSVNDALGAAAPELLSNGNYIVRAPTWDNGAVANAGAVTFGSGITGVVGPITSANSLIGSTAGDQVGSAITLLRNGNYLARSAFWSNAGLASAGAVTLGSGTAGVTGVVSPVNSLVGSTANDSVGSISITPLVLGNGNFVLPTPLWDNGAIADTGAVTFGSGISGVVGPITASNSLVGSTAGDQIGILIQALSNDNYITASPTWDNGLIVDAGAATRGSGTSGIVGTISATNSLVGSTAGDRVGKNLMALTNGNYVVLSPFWNNGAIASAGAATFGGPTGVTGLVSAGNSLVGSSIGEQLGLQTGTALTNGNYVLRDPLWDDGANTNVGAVIWASGTSGITGVVTPANALVGSATNDLVGSEGIVALSNGNYVVASSRWQFTGAALAGAVTPGDGATGTVGAVSASNSLIGITANDQVGALVVALNGGNYAVVSPTWDNVSTQDVGAVTFGPATGIIGPVSISNSLVGNQPGDRVGSAGVTVLSNGNFLVSSPIWANGASASAGALTWGSGISGIVGTVSPANSIVGSSALDQIGASVPVTAANGNFILLSPTWDNGAASNAGAATLGLGDGSVIGPISGTHSVLGATGNGGSALRQAYDPQRNQLIVSDPNANRVVLQRTGVATTLTITADTPDPSIGGQSVTLTATVNAATAPNNGQVTFRASTGETCTANMPVQTSPTTTNFSCTLAFIANGTSMVFAEYTGSVAFAYSRSAFEPHSTTVDAVFKDGFE